MKEVKRTIEVIDYISDSGKEFKATFKQYESDCKADEEKYYYWKEFKESTYDPKLLEKYEPENWQHFKWYLLKDVIRCVTGSFNWDYDNRTFTIYEPNVFNKWQSGEDLQNFLLELICVKNCKKDEEFNLLNFSHGLDVGIKRHTTLTVQNMKVLFSSGLLDLKSIKNRDAVLSEHLLYFFIRRKKLDEVKYLIEEFNLEFTQEHIELALSLLVYQRHDIRDKISLGTVGFKNGDYDYEPFIENGSLLVGGTGKKLIFGSNKEDEYYSLFKYYYTPEIKNLIDFVLDNITEHETAFFNLLRHAWSGPEQWSRMDYLYKYCKKNKIDIIFHKEKLENLIAFHHYYCKSHPLYEENGNYYFNSKDKTQILKLPCIEVFQKFLQIYVNNRSYDSFHEQILEMVERNYKGIDQSILDFWLFEYTKMYNTDRDKVEKLPRKYRERYDDIEAIYMSHPDFCLKEFNCANGDTIDLKGNGEYMHYLAYTINDKEDIDYLTNKWVGRTVYTRSHEVKRVSDVFFGKSEKYRNHRGKNHNVELIVMDSDNHRLTFEEFCAIMKMQRDLYAINYTI